MMASRKSLTRQRILEAAKALADAEGLNAVTMRRLAADLGVEAMSLYHHLPNKSALLDGLVDSIIDEVNEATGNGGVTGWQAAMRARCLAARDVMVRHPWAPALFGTRPAIPTSVVLYYENVLKLLIEGGFSYALAHRALHALGSMPLGFVQELFSPAAGGDTGAPEADLEELVSVLPHMAAMVASEIHANDGDVLGWCDSRAEFEFTLDLLLEGLERRRIAPPAAGGVPRPSS